MKLQKTNPIYITLNDRKAKKSKTIVVYDTDLEEVHDLIIESIKNQENKLKQSE